MKKCFPLFALAAIVVIALASPAPNGAVLSATNAPSDLPGVGIGGAGHGFIAWVFQGDGKVHSAEGTWQAAGGSAAGYEEWKTGGLAPAPASPQTPIFPTWLVSAVSSDGNTIVAWVDQCPGGANRIRAYIKTAAATSATFAIPDGTATLEQLHAAISNDGRAAVVWQRDSSTPAIDAITADTHNASRLLTLSTKAGGSAPNVGAADGGDLVAAWLQPNASGGNASLVASLAVASAAFAAPVTVNSGAQAIGSGSTTSLAVANDGAMIVGYAANCSTCTQSMSMKVAVGKAKTGFTTPVVVSDANTSPQYQPVVAIDRGAAANVKDGQGMVVIWPISSSGGGYTLMAKFGHNSVWSASSQVAAIDGSGPDQSSVAMGGNAAWVAYVNTNAVYYTNSISGAFTAGVKVSGAKSAHPRIAVNDAKQFALGWLDSSGAQPQVRALGCVSGSAGCP